MEASPPPAAAAAAGIDFSDSETCQRHGWVQQEVNPVCYVGVQTDDGCQRAKCGEMEAPPPPPPAAAAAEIAFFDVETTIPSRAAGTRYALLEFGAILVCPRRLVEVGSYSTLIRPADPSSISPASVRCNGITPDSVASAPSFRDVADNVYAILHGRVWAGHNIIRFDCARIREAFADIGRPAPEAKGMIDTLPLLTQRFGRRAGDMKMASLATYFGLGQQKHRSLDDVRMNLEVLKYCATVLFLESSLPDMYSMNGWVYENTIRRNMLNVNTSPEAASAILNSPSDLISNQRNLTFVGTKTILEVNDLAGSSTPESNMGPADLISHIEEMKIDPLDRASAAHNSHEMFSTTIATPEGSSGYAGFLEPYEVLTGCISAMQAPSYQCGRRIVLLHRDTPLQLCGMGLKVQFGISSKFVDYAGRPKLSFVVDVPANLCQIFDACDHLAHRSSLDSGSRSEWRPVMRKNAYSDSSFVRLNIPTAANGDGGIYSTDIYLKEQSGCIQTLVFSRLDAAELDLLFVPGTIVDAYFSFDVYDYQNSAGIRLVAKRLVVHSK